MINRPWCHRTASCRAPEVVREVAYVDAWEWWECHEATRDGGPSPGRPEQPHPFGTSEASLHTQTRY